MPFKQSIAKSENRLFTRSFRILKTLTFEEEKNREKSQLNSFWVALTFAAAAETTSNYIDDINFNWQINLTYGFFCLSFAFYYVRIKEINNVDGFNNNQWCWTAFEMRTSRFVYDILVVRMFQALHKNDICYYFHRSFLHSMKLWFFCSPLSISIIIINFGSFIGNFSSSLANLYVFVHCALCAVAISIVPIANKVQTSFHCDNNNSALSLSLSFRTHMLHWFDSKTADLVDTKTFNCQIWTMVHKMPPLFYRLLCVYAVVDFSVDFDCNSICI